jgi:hypothetical protein
MTHLWGYRNYDTPDNSRNNIFTRRRMSVRDTPCGENDKPLGGTRLYLLRLDGPRSMDSVRHVLGNLSLIEGQSSALAPEKAAALLSKSCRASHRQSTRESSVVHCCAWPLRLCACGT